jgi:hypothetical protein
MPRPSDIRNRREDIAEWHNRAMGINREIELLATDVNTALTIDDVERRRRTLYEILYKLTHQIDNIDNLLNDFPRAEHDTALVPTYAEIKNLRGQVNHNVSYLEDIYMRERGGKRRHKRRTTKRHKRRQVRTRRH